MHNSVDGVSGIYKLDRMRDEEEEEAETEKLGGKGDGNRPGEAGEEQIRSTDTILNSQRERN